MLPLTPLMCRVGSLVAAAVVCSVVATGTVHASLRAGCVGSEDIGMNGAVGWTDAGLLFQTDPATAPGLLIISGPNGIEFRFAGGVGLSQATSEFPFWLVEVPENGIYNLNVDGYECTAEASGVTVSSQSVGSMSQSDDARKGVIIVEQKYLIRWQARSAPVTWGAVKLLKLLGCPADRQRAVERFAKAILESSIGPTSRSFDTYRRVIGLSGKERS